MIRSLEGAARAVLSALLLCLLAATPAAAQCNTTQLCPANANPCNVSAACTINALLPEQHAGTGGNSYGRPGRIKGSVNLPAAHLLDPTTNEFLPPGELRKRFETLGVSGKQVITYCGGGIAASADAFALVMLAKRALGDRKEISVGN